MLCNALTKLNSCPSHPGRGGPFSSVPQEAVENCWAEERVRGAERQPGAVVNADNPTPRIWRKQEDHGLEASLGYIRSSIPA